MTASEIVAALCAQADPKNVAGMARYGISSGRHARRSDAGDSPSGQAGRTQPLSRRGIVGLRHSRSAHPGDHRRSTGARHPPPDEPVSARFRFLGRVR